eukprot:COSAG02_NODE_816_length_16859_cov_15.645764_2_plen_96_part_00
MLAEFEHTTMPHFLLHCAAVSLVVMGVIALVAGEDALAPATGGMDSSVSNVGAAKAPTTPRASALSTTLRARAAAGGGTQRERERGAAAAAKHII